MSGAGEDKGTHADLQQDYFRSRISVFLQPIPEEILERTQKIAESARLSESSQVLDVATGTGALITHFLSLGVKQENITGVDLSEEMLENARERYPKANFIRADILDVDSFISEPEQFDAVFFNACFGNLFDQKLALKKTKVLTRKNGSIVISHPLGKRFVKALHDSDPKIVPHFLPEEAQLQLWAKDLNMRLAEFIDETDFYLARLQ